MEKKIQYRTQETNYNQEENKISGYAAKYEKDSVNMGWGDWKYIERIAKGAFDKVLEKKDDVRCLLNHDPNFVIGRNTSGTLELRADDTGLFFSCEYDPEISWQNDLVKSMKRGDITQCSFAFAWGEEDYTDEVNRQEKTSVRTITNFSKLYDVSVVTYPAYEDTEAYARDLNKLSEEAEKIEQEINTKEQEDKDLVLIAKVKTLL